MNKIFKVVFNKVKGMFVVSSELSKTHGMSKKLKASVTALAAVALMGVVSNAVAEIGPKISINRNGVEFVENEIFQGFSNSEGSGGVIYSRGTLTVIGTTFGGEGDLGNSAQDGGAILSSRFLTLSGENKFTGNMGRSGGAISIGGGTATFSNTSRNTFENNIANFGGVIGIDQNGTLSLSGENEFTNNTANTLGVVLSTAMEL